MSEYIPREPDKIQLELINTFRTRLDEIVQREEYQRPWLTFFERRIDNDPQKLVGGLWLPDYDVQSVVGDDSFVHAILVMETTFDLSLREIETVMSPQYRRLNLAVSPHEVALHGLIGTFSRRQIENDFGIRAV